LSASRTKPHVSGNVSLKNILGNTTGRVVPAWQQSNSSMGDGGGGGGLANTVVAEEQGGVGEDPVSGEATATTATTTQTKGKKERGKQKQTLFTIGSLAT
jgi:E3 ubiquitin-protein ligase ZNF598